MILAIVAELGEVATWMNLSSLMVALVSSTLTFFLAKCFQPNMIFRRYYLLLNYLWIKWRKGKKRKFRPILSPLGLCNVCFGTWIYIISFLLLEGLNWQILIGLGIQAVLVKTFEKLL